MKNKLKRKKECAKEAGMPAEVADEKDVEGCIELIAQFLAKCV
ncbi:hypothetical protein [Blautia obeum]|nr:hypothetical protein [Blautia obeum]